MVDSHALVGCCAQCGAWVHLSAAVEVGGVLEPVGAMPVIIEDDVLVGGNCGVYEGTVVKTRAVLGTGTILNRSTPVYDLVNGTVLRATDAEPLVIPEGAVVVAGSRAVTSGPGKDWGISVYTPVIVKYRDEKNDARNAHSSRERADHFAPRVVVARRPLRGASFVGVTRVTTRSFSFNQVRAAADTLAVVAVVVRAMSFAR